MQVARVFRSSLVVASLVAAILAVPATTTRAQDSASGFWSLPWEKGPVTGRLGNLAEVQVPEGYIFTGKDGTKRFMEMNQNIVAGNEYGTLAPLSSDENWFVVFEYEDIGYVKDDEKDKIDAGALLKSMQEGSREANKERRKRGWSEMEIVGWTSPPAYNAETQNLEWGIQGLSKRPDGTERPVVNHSIRVLGRGGVMSCDIVASPEELDQAIAGFRAILPGFTYLPGKRYFEFKEGDKLAAVGLTGLVLGGAAVAAVKTGFFAKFLKPILLGLLAVFATAGKWLIRKLRPLFGRETAS